MAIKGSGRPDQRSASLSSSPARGRARRSRWSNEASVALRASAVAVAKEVSEADSLTAMEASKMKNVTSGRAGAAAL
jgi:hypothetical protein